MMTGSAKKPYQRLFDVQTGPVHRKGRSYPPQYALLPTPKTVTSLT